MDGCNDHRAEIILVTLGIIHMLIEWMLGKRAAKNGGPGSLMAVLFSFLGVAASFILSLARKRKPGG